MAEAFAIIGLVTMIVDPVELRRKVIGRLNEFKSASKEVLESFRAIATQLPLYLNTLQLMKAQAEKGDISSTSAQALKTVVSTSIDLTTKLENILTKALPAKHATTFEKRLAALGSLGKDKEVLECGDQLERNIKPLVFYQTTHHSEISAQILSALSQLRLTPATRASSFSLDSWPQEHVNVLEPSTRPITKLIGELILPDSLEPIHGFWNTLGIRSGIKSECLICFGFQLMRRAANLSFHLI